MQASRLSFTKHSTRFLVGSALSVLAAQAVMAAPVVVTEDGDVAVDEDTATGTPTAVVVSSQSGSVTVAIDNVTSTSTAGQLAEAIIVSSDPGAIDANFGTVSVTGDGDVRAASVTSGSGDISLTVGTIAVDTTGGAGILVASESGDISIVASDVVVASQVGLNGGAGGLPEAILAQSNQGSVTIAAGNASTQGEFGSAVVALSGTTSDVTIDSASATSDGAVTVLLNAGTSATLDAGSVVMEGQGNGIEVIAQQAANISADSVRAGSIGIYAAAPETISISAGDVEAARGVYADGAATTTTTVAISGGISATQYGVYAYGQTIDFSMLEGSVVGSSGAGVILDANTLINADVRDIAATGTALRATTYVPGGIVTVTASGEITSATSGAIILVGSEANLAIADDSLVAASAGAAAVEVVATDGDANVVNAGEVYASDAAASGIQVQATGDIVIDSALVVLESEMAQGSNYPTGGISAQSIGGGNVAITAETTNVAAPDRNGVAASAVGDGNIEITVGTVTNSGDDRVSLRGAAENGDVTLIGTDVTATGTAGVGAFGFSQGGNVTIAVETVTSTGTGIINGHTADGAFANAVNGFADVTVGTASVAGYAASAIVALGGTGASVVADTVINTGDLGASTYAYSASGNVSVAVGSTLLDGIDSAAINAISDGGTVTVESGTISAGENAQRVSGIFALALGDISVTSGSIVVDEYGVFANSYGGGNVSIASDTIEITQPEAFYGLRARATGAGSITIANGSLTTAQDDFYALSAEGQLGAIAIATGSISASGAETIGVYASGRGGITVNVDGDISTQSRGMFLLSSDGMSESTITGSVTSANSSAVLQVGASTQTTVEAGGVLTGALTGVVHTGWNTGGTAVIRNSGTITGDLAGIAVTALGETLDNPDGAIAPAPDVYIFNDGTIVGNQGLAVFTRDGSDIVELTENSVVEGLIDLGAGFDSLELGLNDDVTTGTGQVAQTVNVERLNLSSGTWIAETGNSYYDTVVLDPGSRLVVRQVDGESAIDTGSVGLDGVLELDFDTDTAPGDFSAISIDGDGSLVLTGSATVLFDDTSGLQYTGGTFVENGTLLLTDEYGYNVYTSGDGTFQLGDGGTAGNLTGALVNDGIFVFARSDDYTFSGDFSGTGSFDKYGSGRILFDGLYAFDGLTTIFDGSVALAGQLAADTQLQISGGVFDLSEVEGGTQTVASLSGTGGTLVLGDISLTVVQTGTTSYFGDITGSGEFIVDGTGDLKLEGDISFTGDAIIDGGTLSVNGSMTGAEFFVNEGGTLGGDGEVGPVFVDGGTLGAGNSIGTLAVVGDLSLTAASIFEIEVNAAGEADRVDVTGTATLGGATASILAEDGTYAPFTEYTVLTAGSVVGTFGDVTTNYAFLTPEFAYNATAVSLILRRNDIAFGDLGATDNQSAVGSLIEDLAVGSVLYNEALLLTTNEVAPAFETLTGEAYPAYLGSMVETADMLRAQLRPAAGEGVFAWGTGLLGKVDGSGAGFREAELDSKGFAGGFGYGAGALSASIGLGKVWHDADTLDISDAETTVLDARVAYGQGLGFSGEVGVQKGWSDATIARRATLGTITDNLVGTIDGDYLQVFGEAGYLFGNETVAFGPFVGLSSVSVDADDFAETGGVTALDIADLDRTVTFGRVGAKLDARMAGGLMLGANAAYRLAWGDRENTATVSFAGNGADVAIGALPIDKSAWELGASVGYQAGRFAIEAGYAGTFSDTYDSHGGRIGLSISF